MNLARVSRTPAFVLFFFLVCLCLTHGDAWAQTAETPSTGPVESVYDVTFDVALIPSEKSAHVAIQLGAGSEVVEWIRFSFDPLRYRAIEADGKLEEVEGRLQWTPPKGGGTLRYIFSIDHLRDDNSYDSRCAKSWAIMRGQDLVPRMRIRTSVLADSKSVLRIQTPEGWASALPYDALRGGRYSLDDEGTHFDRPSGWLAFGELGVVRETIEDVRVSIAGPSGQGARRMDLLALMRWTLPTFKSLFGKLPERLQVVVAGDPMWRGGLSGPRSLYLHVDRPLISADGSSPLVHELMHALMHARSGEQGEWIVEGIAEYYSIALLRRSETLSASRFEQTIEAIRERARKSRVTLDSDMSTYVRAKAVVALLELDEMIRSATGGARSLDDVVRRLASRDRAITPKALKNAAQKVAGREFSAFFDALVPARK